jgi:hypothetical protein
MIFWTHRNHRTAFDDASDLSDPPSGGPLKMWLVGAGIAAIPVGYGIRCWMTGHAMFIGRGSNLDLTGPAATAMAIAYMAVGVFIHGHWFWGLHPRLERFCSIPKVLAALTFIGSFGYTLHRIIG